MNIVNLTPHRITVIVENEKGKQTYEFPPSGQVARISAIQILAATIEGIPVVKTVFGDVENLSEPSEGTIYIVSSLVAQALAGKRNDLVSPDSGPTAYRDKDGYITAVQRFQQW